MLLIGGSDRIVITHLNGTGLQPMRSLSVNGTLALDFQHSQESVCWVLSTESSGQLCCAETRNLRGFTREQEIRTQQRLLSTFSAVLFFSFSYFSDKFKWLSALKSWTHSPTRIKDSSASFLRYIRISPSTLSHTGSSFFRSLFLSHHCYLGALHLFIICAVESRLASAVLATHLVPLQLSFKPTSYTIFTISKKLFSPHPPFADLVSQISDRLDITFVWFTHGFLSVFLFVTMRQNVYSSDSLPIVSYSCTNLEQQTNTCIRGVWLLPLLLCIMCNVCIMFI